MQLLSEASCPFTEPTRHRELSNNFSPLIRARYYTGGLTKRVMALRGELSIYGAIPSPRAIK
ncbi:hypothetical protein J6590_002720 [Homalodisca vitripennis]|nr:hypothetical protein J6590_002720 [Homalodisca vitripennis]